MERAPTFPPVLLQKFLITMSITEKYRLGAGNEKVSGTRGTYHIVKQDNHMLCDGIHDAIIDEEMWDKVQENRKAQAKRYERVNKGKDEKIHLLSGLLCCPICGAGMYGNKSIKKKANEEQY